MTLTDARTSLLDSADSSPWATDPYFTHTVELLRCVRDHDFDVLAALCDELDVVDPDQRGLNVMERTGEGWKAWSTPLLGELDATATEEAA